jgi:hypothetical protein
MFASVSAHHTAASCCVLLFRGFVAPDARFSGRDGVSQVSHCGRSRAAAQADRSRELAGRSMPITYLLAIDLPGGCRAPECRAGGQRFAVITSGWGCSVRKDTQMFGSVGVCRVRYR